MPEDWSITKELASDPVNVYVIWPFAPRSGSRAVTPRTKAPVRIIKRKIIQVSIVKNNKDISIRYYYTGNLKIQTNHLFSRLKELKKGFKIDKTCNSYLKYRE